MLILYTTEGGRSQIQLRAENDTVIPEPSSLGLLALAILTALSKRRRR